MYVLLKYILSTILLSFKLLTRLPLIFSKFFPGFQNFFKVFKSTYFLEEKLFKNAIKITLQFFSNFLQANF